MKDGSNSNKAVNSITVNNLQEDDGILEIVVSLDLTSKEKEKFGKQFDGEDYSSSYWAAMLSYDYDSDELTVTKVYYLTSEDAEEYEPGLNSSELKEVKKYIMENVIDE